ncbi:hypothetical protein FIBSPDRAFT_496447 [Athelia psychrophila]|uniref:DUF7918 domain-containing protein n=1 Tax=Athelia psychrophila TaxID=1759441 RepID=A0A167TT70_9AGAM|nr:hypothetical protein FIBSPDRAFT_496447 [Fibularhizoctonia sp. CBS 109695]
MEGHCPQELGIIQLDMWRVNSFNVNPIYEDEGSTDSDSDWGSDSDSGSEWVPSDEDEDEDEDDSVPKFIQAVHERDAKVKSAEHRIRPGKVVVYENRQANKTRVSITERQPVYTFKFLYRSMDVLIAKGIAPPRQSEASAPHDGRLDASRTPQAAERPPSISSLAQPHQHTQDDGRTPEETVVVGPKLEDKDEPLLFPDDADVRQTRPLKFEDNDEPLLFPDSDDDEDDVHQTRPLKLEDNDNGLCATSQQSRRRSRPKLSSQLMIKSLWQRLRTKRSRTISGRRNSRD